MAMAQVSWEDQLGILREKFARIEDTSRSGACLRIGTPITTGSKLNVKWHKEQFSGIARYCRRDGMEYVLGVQREDSEDKAGTIALMDRPAKDDSLPSSAAVLEAPAVQVNKVPNLLQPRPEPETPPEAADLGKLSVPEVVVTVVLDASAAHGREEDSVEPSTGHSQVSMTCRQEERQTIEPSESQERTPMLSKLLHLGHGDRPKDAKDRDGGNKPAQTSSTDGKAAPENPNRKKSEGLSLSSANGNLLAPQDLYLAVGIMSQRVGYSISTVAEMMESEHLRGMTDDVKRASILMALEAAGIPSDEVLQDGMHRLNATNAYETSQRKHFDEFEARKVQENAEIQAEIERITAICHDLTEHNVGEVALAKAALRDWQAKKQKEVQRISEAMVLVTKPAAVKEPSDMKSAPKRVDTVSKN